MSGGKFTIVRTRCARRLASGFVGGLLLAPWAASSQLVWGEGPTSESAAFVDDHGQTRPSERSIVVGAGKAAHDVAVATDSNDGDVLEPIAPASGAEPDLADPPAGSTVAMEPTLADDYVDVVASGQAPAAVGTDNAPAVDDVCVEQEAAANQPATPPVIQAATFNGATPAVTSRGDILRQWGEPLAEADDQATLIYELEGFTSVSVSFDGDVLHTLCVQLAAPAPIERVIEKLNLADLQPAHLVDDAGHTISTIFPERGVTLNCRGDFPAVATDGAAARESEHRDVVDEIVLQPITGEAFLVRAETTSPRAYTSRMADLKAALRLNGRSARARWLLSNLKLATGAAVEAEALAAEAVDLDPRNNDYRLQRVRCLKYLARYDQAVEQTRLVLESDATTKIQRAEALEQMGLLASLGPKDVQQRAVPLHNKAIEVADELTASDDATERIAATQLLVGAHLAMAECIATGEWQNKDEFVAQWLTRASALAEQMIEAGDADVSLRLQVALSALSAGAKLRPPIDPQLWITEAEQAAAELAAEVDDALAGAEIDWQMGLAYLYATEMSHRRSEADKALEFGALSEAKLRDGRRSREELPDANFVLGRLYFQIGAVHAVLRDDHISACEWYNRAIDPLSQPVPVTCMAGPGQHGDALVSMAVSYWETGDRERAYELTGAGIELVEQGIAEGLLDQGSLDAAQSNFEAMSRALGKIDLSTPHDAAKVASKSPPKATSRATSSNRSGAHSASRRNSASSDVRRR